MNRTVEDILKEAEEFQRLGTSLIARGIPIVVNPSIEWMRDAVKTAPFDERFDWYGVGCVVRCNGCRGIVTRVVENEGLREVKLQSEVVYIDFRELRYLDEPEA